LVFLHEDIYKPGTLFISTYTGVIVNTITIIYSIIMLGDISPYLIITPVVAMPFLIWCFVKYRKATYVQNQLYREADGKMRNSVATTIACSDDGVVEEFKHNNNEYTNKRIQIGLFNNKYSTIFSAIRIAIYVVSCVVAGVLVINGQILIGEYLIFTAFVSTIFSQLTSLLSTFVNINAIAPRVQIVQNVMEELNNETK